MRSPLVTFALCWVALPVGLTPMEADAQVQCGDTITEDATLQENLSCLTGLTLVGPASLDLNGYSVSCDCPRVIAVTGRQARLHSGTVAISSGGPRVTLTGEGHHRVHDVQISGARGAAIAIVSPRNLIVHNRISSIVSTPAVDVLAEHNVIRNNEITTFLGAVMVAFPKNRILGNHISTLDGTPLTLHGLANRTHVRDNIIRAGGDEQFRPAGIEVDTDRNIIVHNEVTRYKEGIKLEQGAERNRVIRNTAINSLNLDLVDENVDCDGNIWAAEHF